jgi:arylsulfatase A
MHPPRESVEKFPASGTPRSIAAQTATCRIRGPRAGYAAMISDLDGYVGRVLAALDKPGVADRTLVIFTSDNGTTHEGPPDRSFHRRRRPEVLQQHRRPARLQGQRLRGRHPRADDRRLPGRIAAGAVNDTPGYFADWFPTLCDAAGLEKPAGLDGESLWPVLTGEPSRSMRASR